MPHARNLRKGRVSISGHVYVVTTATHEREPLFSDHDAARVVIRSFRYCDEKKYTTTLAFVVMPDHMHWMFQLGEMLSLSGVVNVFKNRSAYELRKSGRIWQRGFHDHAVRSDEDMKAQARYLIANPLRAGLVESIGDYPWWDAVWIDTPDFAL